MPRVRAGYKGKYKLSKHEFYMAYHYALQYQELMSEYNALADPSTGIRYDTDHVQATQIDTTEINGIRRAEIRDKMDKIEQAAVEADPELSRFILLGVTSEGVTYDVLHQKYKIPLSRNRYYDRRRRYYWILSQKIV